MRQANLLPILLVAATIVTLFFSCGEGEDDLDAINRALADRLTDALHFDNGVIQTDELPEWQSVAEAPQITEYEVPLSLQFEKDFSITLKSEYLSYEDVSKAVVYVSNATRYIAVEESLEPGDDGLYTMQLNGRLEKDEDIDGESFSVHVALQTTEGVTGEYILWEFRVGESGLDATAEKLITDACNSLEQYCSDGDYVWSLYGVDSAAKCTSVYSCAYRFYLDDDNCLNNLATGCRCLESLADSDGCTHCDNLFQNMPRECEFPAECFE